MRTETITERIEEIKDKIINILRSYNVKKAALFGSVVRGDDTEESDIDILIDFNGSLLDMVSLKFELEDALGRKVDLITYKSIHPLLKDYILADQEAIL